MKKKYLYSFMGCAALLALATAPGRAAIAQAFDTVVSANGPQKAEGEEETHREVGLYSPSAVSAIFDVETGFINLEFTTPNLAYWKDGTWPNFTDEDKLNFPIEKIVISRCEGSYFYESEAELVTEMTDVEWLTDYTYTDETKLEHGKSYVYQFVGYCNGCKGSASTAKVDVGYKIDPAEDFSVVAGENGAMEVTVSFTTPTTTNNGKHVISEGETIEKIEITREDYDSWEIKEEVIYTFNDVAPGTELSYTDKDEALKPGTRYQYRALLYFDGILTKDYMNNEIVFVGPDQPKAPSNVTAVLQEDGSIKVTWEAPTEGVNGGWLDLSLVRFKIERGLGTSEYYARWTELENGYEGTEIVDTDLPEEGMYLYRISSQVGENTYRGAVTEGVVAGPPASFPFTESWPDRVAEHTSWTEGSGDWTVGYSTYIYYYDENNNYSTLDIGPADGDGGMMYTYPGWSDEPGDICTLTSGRIAMADAINPVVKFSFFDLSKDLDDNEFRVYAAADGGEFKQLEDVDLSGFPHDNQWVSVMGSLAEYVEACEYIQIRFEITLGEKKCKTVIDAVEVRDAKFADLTVQSVSAPEKFYPGASMNVGVKIFNSGDFDSEPFATMLYINGEELGYAECEGVATLGTKVMSVPVTIPETVNGGETEISVEIIGVWEPNMEDNTGSKAVEVIALPAPSGLDFNADDKLLTWSAVAELPFYDGSNEVADDFSAYDDCATGEFGGWTVVDGDGASTYCLPVYENYINERGATGGFVFQPSQHADDVMNSYAAPWDTPEAGGKCFVFPGCTTTANDWLISPELTGAAQTVTYKLAAFSSYGSVREKYEFCVSYTDAQPESFEVLRYEFIDKDNKTDEDGNYVIEWNDYSDELPEGVKYFAIHYIQGYGDMLAVTDFHFTTGSGMTSDPTEFVGYNVYLGGSKVNEEPLTETKYEVPAETEGDYVVKAVYNNAESAPSEALSVNTTGVDAAGAAAGKLLSVEGTTLVISGTGAYTVADVAGRTVAAGNGAARVAVAAGTYVVAVDGEVFKVAVK